MYICKENKSPSNEKISSNNYFSFEECKNNINILESIIEYIRNIEHALKEILQQNINLREQMKNKGIFSVSECDNESFIKKYSYSFNHDLIGQLEKIINKFKLSFNEEKKFLMNESCKKDNKEEFIKKENAHEKDIFEISDEIKEIKNYYEGKIDIMQKKIKVSEILESLYLKQIDEFKKKLNKNRTNELIKIEEN
jgi:hypothetical protein